MGARSLLNRAKTTTEVVIVVSVASPSPTSLRCHARSQDGQTDWTEHQKVLRYTGQKRVGNGPAFVVTSSRVA
jgi:hypothetical protein